jgi:PAS domain S-box-containing protein
VLSPWRPADQRRPVLVALAVPALLAVAATVMLAVLTANATRALSDNVRVTQDLVDGNVRTLSQVQRELLRLEQGLTATEPDPERIELVRSFAAQRIQEATLAYQGRTLNEPALLQRSRDLSARWRSVLDPQVRAIGADPTALTSAERERLAKDVVQLEQSYNQLVSDAENSRKQEAQRANAATERLVVDTRWLIVGLVVTLVALVTLVAGMVRLLLAARRAQVVQAERLQDARALLQRHSLAVQTTDNLVVITDDAGHIEWVNEAFTRRTGYALEDVVGRSPGRLLQGPDTDPATVALMGAKIRDREPFLCEVLNYTRAGDPYWVSLEVRPIIDEEGVATGFVAVQNDVTKRRLTEAALRAAKVTAEDTARSKERFLASMSHEIRTPLNAVLGLTELLQNTELDDEQRSYVATAHQSGRHLLAIVNDILDYSALDSGAVEVESRDADPRSMVSDVCAMLQPVADRAGLHLGWTADPEVPSTVLTDVVKLRQVLINLVGNGLKFTDRGGVSVQVGFRRDDDAQVGDGEAVHGILVVSVVDTGVGIPADRLDRIFQPFTQVDPSTTRTHGGTGLGLAICTQIADRLGGSLDASSVEGEGSTFTLAVPVVHRRETVLADRAPAEPPSPGTGDVEVLPLAVLIAEDDRVNRMVALHMLRRLGLEADVATDGLEAVAACNAREYDVVLMDVNMPHLDGLAATARLRERAGRQPWVVALTANAMEGDRERMLDGGADDYLSKPFTLEDLRRAFDTAAEHGHVGTRVPAAPAGGPSRWTS